jgi:hypothetical protein
MELPLAEKTHFLFLLTSSLLAPGSGNGGFFNYRCTEVSEQERKMSGIRFLPLKPLWL